MYQKNGIYMVIIMLALVFIWEFMVYADAKQDKGCYDYEQDITADKNGFSGDENCVAADNYVIAADKYEIYGNEYGVSGGEYGITTDEYRIPANGYGISISEYDITANKYDIPVNESDIFTKDDLKFHQDTSAGNPVWNQQEFCANLEAENILINLSKENNQVMIEKNVGVARIQVCKVLEKHYKYSISESEREILERIVEAEACGEDIDGKKLVANVVMNRVQSKSFPDTIEEVIFQKDGGVYQFSPIYDGRYYSVSVSEESREAVEKVLLGEDNSEGALYFMSRNYADSDKAKWFDRHLTKLFVYGGHEFFR